MRAIVILLGVLFLASCAGKKGNIAENDRIVSVPKASGDSAYNFVRKQVDFGPRVPNTKSHRQTGDYLVETLKRYGAQVSVQAFEALSYDNQKLQLRNIVASFYPEKQKRIMLAAHWDTRPFADNDKEKPNAPFDGANDGASGVGVLLEVARILKNNAAPDVGIDIFFFDGEDYGEPDGVQSASHLPDGFKEWWCLGSQYWSLHKHKPGYSAYYGILVDMVGSNGAKFYREGTSLELAPTIVEKVWKRAGKMGYANVFVTTNVAAITDDHSFINQMAKIPMIDIIHHDPSTGSFFGDYHHTTKDNMSIISAETLRIVTDVVLNVIYYEQ